MWRVSCELCIWSLEGADRDMTKRPRPGLWVLDAGARDNGCCQSGECGLVVRSGDSNSHYGQNYDSVSGIESEHNPGTEYHFTLQILVLFFFPFDVLSQRTLSHGLPLLNRGHPPHLHKPHFLPLMRTHPPSPTRNYSPTPLPPLLNTPLLSTPNHHHSAPPHHHAHSLYRPKENNNDVYDVSELNLRQSMFLYNQLSINLS